MNRTIAITGSASGIGKATAVLAAERGFTPICIDLQEGDICVDLGRPSGRAAMLTEVATQSGGKLDAVIACAGLPDSAAEAIINVNYFGAIATLEGLRPLLLNGDHPRAVAISSIASVVRAAIDPELVAACLDNDEVAASNMVNRNPDAQTQYGSSKAALCRWLRRESIKPAWVGEGILLNAIAPGLVQTAMTQSVIDDPDLIAQYNRALPRPMARPLGAPEMAELLLWLAGPANTTLVGQVIFADGGAEVTMRGDEVW